MFRLFFGCFAKPIKHFFRFVLVFRTGIETTKTNITLSKQTKKISIKHSLLGGLETVSFFSRFEPKQTETQSVSVVVRFVFSRNQKFFFCLFRCFRPVSKQLKQTELMVWGIKKVDIFTNLLLFRLVFCLFRFFRNTKTPCFNIKAKQPKQTSCFGYYRNWFRFQFRLFRYETSFGRHPSFALASTGKNSASFPPLSHDNLI
jgi:hypothetical protein